MCGLEDKQEGSDGTLVHHFVPHVYGPPGPRALWGQVGR